MPSPENAMHLYIFNSKLDGLQCIWRHTAI